MSVSSWVLIRTEWRTTNPFWVSIKVELLLINLSRCRSPNRWWSNPHGIGPGRERSPEAICGGNRDRSLTDLTTTDEGNDTCSFPGFGGVPVRCQWCPNPVGIGPREGTLPETIWGVSWSGYVIHSSDRYSSDLGSTWLQTFYWDSRSTHPSLNLNREDKPDASDGGFGHHRSGVRFLIFPRFWGDDVSKKFEIYRRVGKGSKERRRGRRWRGVRVVRWVWTPWVLQ